MIIANIEDFYPISCTIMLQMYYPNKFNVIFSVIAK